MPLRHTLLALAVVAIWGLSFVSIKLALQELPPFALSAWRFTLAAVPLVFLVGRPKGSLLKLAAYGWLIAVGQFGILFIAVKLGMPAGLASLLVQSQVFVTIAWSVALLGEPAKPTQLIGSLIAACGLALIGWSKMQSGLGLSFALVLCAAFCWGTGNTVAKTLGKVDALNLIAWSSLFALPPLLALSWLFEPPASLLIPLLQPSPGLWFNIAVLAYAATVFGFGTWAKLLSQHPAAQVAPFALLVPITGIASAAVAFNERLTAVQWLGAAVVLLGIGVVVLNFRWKKRL
jgi:O-acetylserine/cysteine efflux transporter